jgi:L-alanine-DL-glutamate epimerase-like enolase superfamily enzyme
VFVKLVTDDGIHGWGEAFGSEVPQVSVEAVNVTNEQEVIGINRANAQPLPGIAAFQTPREYHGQIGIEF